MLKKLGIIVGLLFVFAFAMIWLQSGTMSRAVAADRTRLKVGMTPVEVLTVVRRWAFASATPIAVEQSARPLLFTNFHDSVICAGFEPNEMNWDRFLAELGKRQEQLADTQWLFTYKAGSTPAKISFSVTFEQGKVKEIGQQYGWD